MMVSHSSAIALHRVAKVGHRGEPCHAGHHRVLLGSACQAETVTLALTIRIYRCIRSNFPLGVVARIRAGFLLSRIYYGRESSVTTLCLECS